MAYLEPDASDMSVPPANNMVHVERNGSNAGPTISNIGHSRSNVANAVPLTPSGATRPEPNAGPQPANDIARPGPNAINTGAQMQDVNSPSADNNRPTAKGGNDGIKLFEVI
jgi:hypothetical protein